jgi:two-component system sensor histidine kinase/response regulator
VFVVLDLGIKSVRLRFPSKHVLLPRSADLLVDSGQLVCFAGPRGSKKAGVMTPSDLVMVRSYDLPLVILSVLIAVLASYAALDLAGRVTSARGRARSVWLSGGATAMGIGIWSMHYVGMLAFRLPIPVQYDWPTVFISLLAAVFASAIALFVVSRKKMGPIQAIIGSVFMGSAIAGMHYIGMAAMRLPAMCHYSRGIVMISVVLAIVISFVALWLTFHFRGETRSGGWQKTLSAVVMGAAVPVMHYTGMAAASFTPSMSTKGDVSHALSISSVGTTSIIVVTFMVLGLTVLTSVFDRRFSAQALELESSERRYQQIVVATALDAFVGMDSKGLVVDWNQQAEATFGWPRDEAMGQVLAQMIVPERYRIAHEKGLRHFLVSGEGPVLSKRIEITALHRDGHEFPVELMISVLQSGGALLFAAFVRDITERKHSEQALRAAKEAAEAASEAKSTFLATMSHEIRTPMNGILGMTELVLDTDLTVEQREHLGLVRLSAESLLSVINDILDFSKIEAGKLNLESIPFDLRESIGETMKSLSFRAHQKGLELIYDVQPDVPEPLLGDASRIRQILVNLVGNAIKFTEQGEVFVNVEEESHETGVTCLHFVVKDTGVGILAEKQTKIFEAFSQADGSMARKYGGTGLGLTICTRLVTMMGGAIWVESEPGQGSKFHFTLRLAVQDKPPAGSAPLQPELLRDLHALIVDDNFTNRRVLNGMLTRWGMKPTAVEGGRAALQALEVAKSTGRPFPLILLDGQMPEMDGFALAERIKKDPGLVGATIMMLTSAGHLGDAARCRELGISAYLVKPIRQGELLQAICNVLHLSKQEQAPLVTRHTLREARNRSRVLLAEDNLVNQTLAVRLLEKRGYLVSVAANGREALTALEKERFDVVLMDIQMPEMDGFEATATIRKREKSTGKHIPIIALTAHALKSDQERCLSAGMDAYISKPIRTNELFATIKKLLGKGEGAEASDTVENTEKLTHQG